MLDFGSYVMRKSIWIIVFLTIILKVQAQQDPQFSQNMWNHMTVNPGFAGEQGKWTVSGIYRNQWTKMDGAPETYALNVDGPVRLGGTRGGVGLNIMSDKLGMQTYLHLLGNYSYKLAFDFGVLSIGIKVGIVNAKIEGEYYIPKGDGYTPPGSDPALNGENIDLSKILFDAGVGAFLTGKGYYVGAAVSHLNKARFTIGQSGSFFMARHMYMTGGYTWELSSKFDLQPSVFVKTDFVSTQYNVNMNAVFNRKYWGGVSYRYQEAVVFMGGLELKNGMVVGYSYDWNVEGVGKYTGGSHEVTLSYSFGVRLGKREKLYKSVRFL